MGLDFHHGGIIQWCGKTKFEWIFSLFCLYEVFSLAVQTVFYYYLICCLIFSILRNGSLKILWINNDIKSSIFFCSKYGIYVYVKLKAKMIKCITVIICLNNYWIQHQNFEIKSVQYLKNGDFLIFTIVFLGFMKT